jgi:hypothetical protein
LFLFQICKTKCVSVRPEDDISGLFVSSGGESVNSDIDSKSEQGLAMGVRQIWVRAEHRRRGVAGLLMDAARRDFMCGGVKKTAIAFSQPTLAGRSFAFSYIKRDSILAYDGK